MKKISCFIIVLLSNFYRLACQADEHVLIIPYTINGDIKRTYDTSVDISDDQDFSILVKMKDANSNDVSPFYTVKKRLFEAPIEPDEGKKYKLYVYISVDRETFITSDSGRTFLVECSTEKVPFFNSQPTTDGLSNVTSTKASSTPPWTGLRPANYNSGDAFVIVTCSYSNTNNTNKIKFFFPPIDVFGSNSGDVSTYLYYKYHIY